MVEKWQFGAVNGARSENLLGGWIDNTVGSAFSLHAANLDSVPSTPCGPLRLARNDP